MKHEYKSKEARAGHEYNISKKHRRHESVGMHDAMKKKYPGSHHRDGAHCPGHENHMKHAHRKK